MCCQIRGKHYLHAVLCVGSDSTMKQHTSPYLITLLYSQIISYRCKRWNPASLPHSFIIICDIDYFANISSCIIYMAFYRWQVFTDTHLLANEIIKVVLETLYFQVLISVLGPANVRSYKHSMRLTQPAFTLNSQCMLKSIFWYGTKMLYLSQQSHVRPAENIALSPFCIAKQSLLSENCSQAAPRLDRQNPSSALF